MTPEYHAIIEQLKGLLKDHEGDWKRIQDAERKCASLTEEIACLRSVLSEFDGDKYEYSQMVRADEIRDERAKVGE